MIPCLAVEYENPQAAKALMHSVYAQEVQCVYSSWRNTPNANLGYTAAMNRLIHVWRNAHCLVLLNQDVVLRPDTVGNAVMFMDRHPRCAIAGFKQLHPSDPDQIYHGGGAEILPGHHLGGRVSRGDCAESTKMGWVNGAAVIVRTEAIADMGPMDERFFLYCGDSDWCLTALARGWEVWYCAEAVCLHGGGCSTKQTPEQAEILQRDHVAFIDKWGSIPGEPAFLSE